MLKKLLHHLISAMRCSAIKSFLLPAYYRLSPFHRTLRNDQARFRQAHGRAILPSPQLPASSPLCLVAAFHEFIPSLKIEGLLAKALQHHGVRPLPLIFRRQRHGSELLACFGFDQCVCFDDYFRPEDRPRAEQVVDAFFADKPSLDDCLDFAHDGVFVGNHALSWVVRQRHSANLDLDTPGFTADLRATFVDAIIHAKAAERLYRAFRPRHALFNERGYVPYGELFDVLLQNQVDCVQWVGAHRNDALHFKRYTYGEQTVHPVSLSPDTWKRICAAAIPEQKIEDFFATHGEYYKKGEWFERHRNQTGKTVESKEHVQQVLGLDPGKKTAVIFSHMMWDASFFYGKGLYKDYATWLVETLRVACRNPALNWVVKIHPTNVWRLKEDNFDAELAEYVLIREQIGQLPDHVRMMPPETPINTLSLYNMIDYGLTVRGTVGMELPMYGIPAILGGTGRYSGLGFTCDCSTVAAYERQLAHLQELPPLPPEQIALARRHAYAIFNLRPMTTTSFKMDFSPRLGHARSLVPDVILNLKSPDELANAPDLTAFVDWVRDGEQRDLMGGCP